MIHTIAALLTLVSLAAGGPAPAPVATIQKDAITVYRSKTCGCCGKWVEHLKAAGFDVTAHVVDTIENAPGRDRVPKELRSCHIAKVRNYVIEGHVPADVIKDLLRKRPELEGLAVPGMPAGSPGMESPNPVSYEIIGWDRTGKPSVFAKR
jgi:hypothetical protein